MTASQDTPPPADQADQDREDDRGGQVSEGPSSFDDSETSLGGADAVPDTPDVNPGVSAPIQE